MNDETDRNRQLDTLRADYSVRDEAAVYYRAGMQAFFGGPRLCCRASKPTEHAGLAMQISKRACRSGSAILTMSSR
jgi:hypothetical protein